MHMNIREFDWVSQWPTKREKKKNCQRGNVQVFDVTPKINDSSGDVWWSGIEYFDILCHVYIITKIISVDKIFPMMCDRIPIN